MKFLFITGIPGTGKTTIGDYLQDKYGFYHLNLEDEKGNTQTLADIENNIQSLLAECKQKDHNLVVTWGFGPNIPDHIELVNKILKRGAKMIWLDGNRQAAEKSFLNRGTVSKELLDLQMERINKVDIKNTFHPTF
jgi:shikimate kinase